MPVKHRWFQRSSRSPGDEAASALADARTLVDRGVPREAIERLTAANRRTRDARLERELVGLRHRAFALVDHTGPVRPPFEVRAAGTGGPLHSVAASDLSAETLSAGLAQHGCVLVRGLVDRGRVERLVDGIDRTFDAIDRALAGAPVSETEPWFVPFEPAAGGEYRIGGRHNWMRKSGGIWTADSPRMLFELLELVDDLGIGRLVTEYLGERPALSANKCTLRRVPVENTNAQWHQDGAFLGPQTRSVNFWLALSECGIDAPGLDIVPQRIDRVLPTGTDGALFDWAVAPAIVGEASDVPVIRPEFQPGDALLFDHLFLHRTAAVAGMTSERYAMETWFFAPSTYPEGQIPLLY